MYVCIYIYIYIYTHIEYIYIEQNATIWMQKAHIKKLLRSLYKPEVFI